MVLEKLFPVQAGATYCLAMIRANKHCKEKARKLSRTLIINPAVTGRQSSVIPCPVSISDRHFQVLGCSCSPIKQKKQKKVLEYATLVLIRKASGEICTSAPRLFLGERQLSWLRAGCTNNA